LISFQELRFNMSPVLCDERHLKEIEKRIGRDHLARRFEAQAIYSSVMFGNGRPKFFFNGAEIVPAMVNKIIDILGVRKRFERNLVDYRYNEVDVSLKGLPKGFDGYRILHLSDLHIEGVGDKGKKLGSIISEIDCDLCVITGDYHFYGFGDYTETLTLMEQLVSSIRSRMGIIGILGNNDFIELIPGLESMGIRLLINEAIPLDMEMGRIWIAGVDDPHKYKTDDLSRAMEDVPVDSIKILLAHSPELVKDAARAGVDYYLCGHTHGGQICLPGGIPISNNARCSRKYTAGMWQYMTMKGYTSKGAGVSAVRARLFCPPEITLHRLHPA
jgi:predicted MPP superfamily phosphohydrolase